MDERSGRTAVLRVNRDCGRPPFFSAQSAFTTQLDRCVFPVKTPLWAFRHPKEWHALPRNDARKSYQARVISAPGHLLFLVQLKCGSESLCVLVCRGPCRVFLSSCLVTGNRLGCDNRHEHGRSSTQISDRLFVEQGQRSSVALCRSQTYQIGLDADSTH